MLLPAVLLALSSVTTQPVAKPADGEKMVCRRLGQTGSRLASNKVCMTKAQWEERTRNDQKDVNNMLKQPCAEGKGC